MDIAAKMRKSEKRSQLAPSVAFAGPLTSFIRQILLDLPLVALSSYSTIPCDAKASSVEFMRAAGT
jgi:hypothetical protein